MAMTNPQYGVWITNPDGSNGHWLEDNERNDDWHGEQWQAAGYAKDRNDFYGHHRHYEIRPFTDHP